MERGDRREILAEQDEHGLERNWTRASSDGPMRSRPSRPTAAMITITSVSQPKR